MSTADTLQTAMRLHQTGQLQQAEELYRHILSLEPRNSDALHLLGLIAHQMGRSDVAVGFISQAIEIEGSQAIYHNNLGEANRALGRLAEAQANYHRAIWFDPAFGAAHYNLALLLGATQPAEAERHYRQAIHIQPNMALAHNNLGNLLRANGRSREAIDCFREALRLKPDYVDALANLGAALIDLSRTDEAIEQLEHAVRLAPDSAEARFNLGNAYKSVENWEAAALSYEDAVRLRPDFNEAGCNLGNALRILGQTERAEAEYLKVLARRPDHLEGLVGFGALLQSMGRLEEALGFYDRALQVQPDSAAAQYFRGTVLMFRRRRNDAILAFTEAIRLQPNYPEAYANLAIIYNDANHPDKALECCERGLELGSRNVSLFANRAIALHAQGRPRAAIESYRAAVERRPNSSAEYSNLLYAMNFLPEYDAKTLFEEHRRWAEKHADSLMPSDPGHVNDPSPGRRIRLGYVSPHFREHAVNFFIEPILASHDHDRFEVFCYSSTPTPDKVTARLHGMADVWRDALHLGDPQLAERIRDDQIDILIDLSGHMGWTRLLTFALKPAPVQVTYLGYQNTTGMLAMDYRLTDEWSDPPGVTDRYYTEKLVRLPRAFFCYQPFETPDVSPLPAATNGFVTFGSFNNYAKVMPETVDAWFEILSRVPDSRLLVLAYTAGFLEHHLREKARQHGISPDRIELADKCSHDEYMRLVARADIALDPFPFNGHTTTCDCVWMGVPVVMLAGNSYASRFGGSVLRNVGLESLIAGSVEEYQDKAVELAEDRTRLEQLRQTLRPTMADSPLVDHRGFTRRLEAAYREMWETWCATQRRAGGSTPVD